MAFPSTQLGFCVDDLSVQTSASGDDVLLAGQTAFTGRFWTGSVCALTQAERVTKADLRAGVAAVAWIASGSPSEDGMLAVSGSDDGSVDLWQCTQDSNFACLRHLDGKAEHNHVVSSVSTSGSKVASSSWDMQVRVWDSIAFLECIASLRGHSDLVHSVRWSAAPDVLVSASQDRTVRKWDVRSKGCAATLQLQQPVHVAAEEPGGVLLVAGDECGSLTIFDARKPAVQLAHLHGLHHDAVKAIAFPAHGKGALVASAGDDGRICIIPQGQPISAVKQQVLTPHCNGAYIRGLCYGSKGLYSSAWDGSISCSIP